MVGIHRSGGRELYDRYFETLPVKPNTDLRPPSRRQWMTLGAAALAGAARSSAAARPNIVFILIDDLRWDELGCTGHPFAKTPHVDRIAREGVTFRNAFVTTPLCSPSRASYLT